MCVFIVQALVLSLMVVFLHRNVYCLFDVALDFKKSISIYVVHHSKNCFGEIGIVETVFSSLTPQLKNSSLSVNFVHLMQPFSARLFA